MLTEGLNVFDAASAESQDKEEEKETETSESSTETSEQPAGQAEEKEIPKDLKPGEPLHKDARFKRVIEERNRERAEKRELMERLERLEESTKKATPKAQTSESIPAWFANYFGTEAQAQEAWQHLKPVDRDSLKSELRDELRQEQEKQANESQKWDRWVNEQVESLEEEGETFEKNALLKTMDQYRPTDAEGNLDFRKGLELLRMKGDGKEGQLQAKRKAGALANVPSKGSEPNKKNYVTPTDIKKWRLTGEI